MKMTKPNSSGKTIAKPQSEPQFRKLICKH